MDTNDISGGGLIPDNWLRASESVMLRGIDT